MVYAVRHLAQRIHYALRQEGSMRAGGKLAPSVGKISRALADVGAVQRGGMLPPNLPSYQLVLLPEALGVEEEVAQQAVIRGVYRALSGADRVQRQEAISLLGYSPMVPYTVPPKRYWVFDALEMMRMPGEVLSEAERFIVRTTPTDGILKRYPDEWGDLAYVHFGKPKADCLPQGKKENPVPGIACSLEALRQAEKLPLAQVWLVGADGFGSTARNENDIDLVILLRKRSTHPDFRALARRCLFGLKEHWVAKRPLAAKVFGLDQLRAARRLQQRYFGGTVFDLTADQDKLLRRLVVDGKYTEDVTDLAHFYRYVELIGPNRNVLAELPVAKQKLLNRLKSAPDDTALFRKLLSLHTPCDLLISPARRLFRIRWQQFANHPDKERARDLLEVGHFLRVLPTDVLQDEVMQPVAAKLFSVPDPRGRAFLVEFLDRVSSHDPDIDLLAFLRQVFREAALCPSEKIAVLHHVRVDALYLGHYYTSPETLAGIQALARELETAMLAAHARIASPQG